MKPIASIASLLLSLAGPAWAQDGLSEISYPRLVTRDGNSLLIHHPVIDTWTGFEVMEGWIPVEITLAGEQRQWVGAVRASARTVVDTHSRLVRLHGQQVLDVRFSDPAAPAAAVSLARNAVGGKPLTIMLDEILPLLAADFEVQNQGSQPWAFNNRPPQIVVSDSPLQLLLFDSEAIKAPIKGTSLDLVINTDWPVFYDRFSRTWYVVNQGAWQKHSMLATGGWTTTDQLPKDLMTLSIGEDWAEIREAMPPHIPAAEPTPFLVSLEPTELIVMDGAPRLKAVPGAGALHEVSNTEGNLFELDGRWYYLAAGRWFDAASLDGSWSKVEQLPEEFKSIPEDHRRAGVRAYVPGTLESLMALMEAVMPRRVEVAANAQPGEPVAYAGEPWFQPIAGTRVERAINTPYAVVRHDNDYYACLEGAWYIAPAARGPWKPARQVPEEIYEIPPSDPLHYVTYVRPVEAGSGASGTAAYTYNSGYMGRYATGSVVVEGTGFHYSPWVGYPSGYPVYWGYPHTYGWRHGWPGRYYNPYGYWGGYWGTHTITITSPTRTLAGDTETESNRIRHGYTTLEEQRAQALDAGDDLYAGADGNVYRRSDDGWSQHTGSEWSTMAELERPYGVSSGARIGAPEKQQRQAYRQNPDDIARMERYYQSRQKSYNMYGTISVGH